MEPVSILPESPGSHDTLINSRSNVAPPAAVFPSNQMQPIDGSQGQPSPHQQTVFISHLSNRESALGVFAASKQYHSPPIMKSARIAEHTRAGLAWQLRNSWSHASQAVDRGAPVHGLGNPTHDLLTSSWAGDLSFGASVFASVSWAAKTTCLWVVLKIL